MGLFYFKNRLDYYGLMWILERFILLLAKPKACWAIFNKDSSLRSSASFLLATSILSVVFVLSSYYIADTSIRTGVLFLTGTMLLSILIIVVFLFAFSLLSSSRILGNTIKFNTIFMIVVYAYTPFILVLWIPFANIIAFLYTFALGYIGIRKVSNTSSKTALSMMFLAGAIYTGIIMALSLLASVTLKFLLFL